MVLWRGGAVAVSKASVTPFVVGDSATRASLTAYGGEDASEQSKEDEEAHKPRDPMRAETICEGNESCVWTTCEQRSTRKCLLGGECSYRTPAVHH